MMEEMLYEIYADVMTRKLTYRLHAKKYLNEDTSESIDLAPGLDEARYFQRNKIKILLHIYRQILLKNTLICL
jgi:hypothetical protein